MAMRKYTNNENISFAFLFSPLPRVIATKALPPVPTIKPADDSIIRTGITIFTAANAVEPAKLDTKKPSMII